MNVTDYDKISLRAFQIWEAEGRPQGQDLEHWLRAEIELRVVPGAVPVKAKSSSAPKVSAAKAGAAKAGPKSAAPKAPKAATSRRAKAASQD